MWLPQPEDPPYLTVGTEVSAKYKGAFCEAKVHKVVKVVKVKVTFKLGLGSAVVSDDQIRGVLKIGAQVKASHPDKNQFVDAIVNKIQDCSQYTVVFDDGDITTLRRTSLCLKSGRHFAESETLDQLPLTHPEHFGTPVVGGRRGRRSRQNPDGEESGEEEDDMHKRHRLRREEWESDIGKVVCVELGDKKKQKDNWFPGLVVAPTAQDSVKIETKKDYLVRSFQDGRYYTVPKKEASPFNREVGSKVSQSALKTAVEKALLFMTNDELPPHWDRDLLFGMDISDDESDRDGSDSDSSDDEPREEKDHFVAQLYKFMEECGTPINTGPTVGNKDLDLYKLFKVVQKLGGFNRVMNQNHWKMVSNKMQLQTLGSQGPNHIKAAYKRYLQSFEDFYRKLGCTMVSNPRGSRTRHRSGRSLIRDCDRTPRVQKKKENDSCESTEDETESKKEEEEESKKVEAKKEKEEVKKEIPKKEDIKKEEAKKEEPKEEPKKEVEKKEVEKKKEDSKVVKPPKQELVKPEPEPVVTRERSQPLVTRERSREPLITRERSREPIVIREKSREKSREPVKEKVKDQPATKEKSRESSATKETPPETTLPKEKPKEPRTPAKTRSAVKNEEVKTRSTTKEEKNEPAEVKTRASAREEKKETKSKNDKEESDTEEEIEMAQTRASRQREESKEKEESTKKVTTPSRKAKAERVAPGSSTTTSVSTGTAVSTAVVNESEDARQAATGAASGNQGNSSQPSSASGSTSTSTPNSSGNDKKASGKQKPKASKNGSVAIAAAATTAPTPPPPTPTPPAPPPPPSAAATAAAAAAAAAAVAAAAAADDSPGAKKRGRKKRADGELDPPVGRSLIPAHVPVSVGDKLRVLYGPNSKESKVTYEAKVLEVEEEGNAPMYYVHYLGWNTRYDEWIRRPRIAENVTWSQNRAKKGRAAATKELKEKKEKEKEKETKREDKEMAPVTASPKASAGKRGRTSVGTRERRESDRSERSDTSGNSSVSGPSTRASRERILLQPDSPSSVDQRRTRKTLPDTTESDSEDFESDADTESEKSRSQTTSTEPPCNAAISASSSASSTPTSEASITPAPVLSENNSTKEAEVKHEDEEVKVKKEEEKPEPCGKDIDLNAIMSEMKGLDKPIKKEEDRSLKEPPSLIMPPMLSSFPTPEKKTPEPLVKKAVENVPRITESPVKTVSHDPSKLLTPKIESLEDDVYEFKEPEPFDFGEMRSRKEVRAKPSIGMNLPDDVTELDKVKKKCRLRKDGREGEDKSESDSDTTPSPQKRVALSSREPRESPSKRSIIESKETIPVIVEGNITPERKDIAIPTIISPPRKVLVKRETPVKTELNVVPLSEAKVRPELPKSPAPKQAQPDIPKSPTSLPVRMNLTPLKIKPVTGLERPVVTLAKPAIPSSHLLTQAVLPIKESKAQAKPVPKQVFESKVDKPSHVKSEEKIEAKVIPFSQRQQHIFPHLLNRSEPTEKSKEIQPRLITPNIQSPPRDPPPSLESVTPPSQGGSDVERIKRESSVEESIEAVIKRARQDQEDHGKEKSESSTPTPDKKRRTSGRVKKILSREFVPDTSEESDSDGKLSRPEKERRIRRAKMVAEGEKISPLKRGSRPDFEKQLGRREEDFQDDDTEDLETNDEQALDEDESETSPVVSISLRGKGTRVSETGEEQEEEEFRHIRKKPRASASATSKRMEDEAETGLGDLLCEETIPPGSPMTHDAVSTESDQPQRPVIKNEMPFASVPTGSSFGKRGPIPAGQPPAAASQPQMPQLSPQQSSTPHQQMQPLPKPTQQQQLLSQQKSHVMVPQQPCQQKLQHQQTQSYQTQQTQEHLQQSQQLRHSQQQQTHMHNQIQKHHQQLQQHKQQQQNPHQSTQPQSLKPVQQQYQPTHHHQHHQQPQQGLQQSQMQSQKNQQQQQQQQQKSHQQPQIHQQIQSPQQQLKKLPQHLKQQQQVPPLPVSQQSAQQQVQQTQQPIKQSPQHSHQAIPHPQRQQLQQPQHQHIQAPAQHQQVHKQPQHQVVLHQSQIQPPYQQAQTQVSSLQRSWHPPQQVKQHEKQHQEVEQQTLHQNSDHLLQHSYQQKHQQLSPRANSNMTSPITSPSVAVSTSAGIVNSKSSSIAVLSTAAAASTSASCVPVPRSGSAQPSAQTTVIDNTPPTTPESIISNLSDSPRGDNEVSKLEDSSKSGRDSSEVELESLADTHKMDQFSEDSNTMDSTMGSERPRRLGRVGGSGKRQHEDRRHLPQVTLGDGEGSETEEGSVTPAVPKRRRRGPRARASNDPEEEERKKICGTSIGRRRRRHSSSRGGAGVASEDDPETSGLSALSIACSAVRRSRYNFCQELDPDLDASKRIAVLQSRIQDLKRTYLQVKTELASVERRRKKLRRKEREKEAKMEPT